MKLETGMTATSTEGRDIRLGDWLAYNGRLVRVEALGGPERVNGHGSRLARFNKPVSLYAGDSEFTTVRNSASVYLRNTNLYWRVNR